MNLTYDAVSRRQKRVTRYLMLVCFSDGTAVKLVGDEAFRISGIG
jgi:hypothetical protein